jgi:hypothetical protein
MPVAEHVGCIWGYVWSVIGGMWVQSLFDIVNAVIIFCDSDIENSILYLKLGNCTDDSELFVFVVLIWRIYKTNGCKLYIQFQLLAVHVLLKYVLLATCPLCYTSKEFTNFALRKSPFCSQKRGHIPSAMTISWRLPYWREKMP